MSTFSYFSSSGEFTAWKSAFCSFLSTWFMFAFPCNKRLRISRSPFYAIIIKGVYSVII